MLAGNELSTASGATSDRSTCTEEARVAAGARSPGSPCATSPSHAAIGAVTAEDDEEAELLVSHSGLGTSFGHLDDALLNMGAFAPLNRTNSMREPRKEGAEKPLKRAKSEGAALTSAPESKPKLRLSLDYEAAAEMINIALADGTGAPAGGHYEHSASETEVSPSLQLPFGHYAANIQWSTAEYMSLAGLLLCKRVVRTSSNDSRSPSVASVLWLCKASPSYPSDEISLPPLLYRAPTGAALRSADGSRRSNVGLLLWKYATTPPLQFTIQAAGMNVPLLSAFFFLPSFFERTPLTIFGSCWCPPPATSPISFFYIVWYCLLRYFFLSFHWQSLAPLQWERNGRLAPVHNSTIISPQFIPPSAM